MDKSQKDHLPLGGFIATPSSSLNTVLNSQYFIRLAEKSCNVFWIRSADYSIQLYVSPAYETIWGRSRQYLYKHPESWDSYIHPEDCQRMALKVGERSEELVMHETIYNEHYRIIRPDGEIRFIKDTSFPIFDDEDNCIGFAGIAEDVTREQAYEQSLIEAKERAESANRAKSEFLAMISHELRIPLSGIIGMAQLLSVDCLLPGQHDQVEDIIKASEHLLSLVNDLLDLNRLEAGRIELQQAPLDLRQLIEDITDILVFQARVKGLELLVDYEGNVPNKVIGDARALRQVLLNLLGNAVKFTDQGYITVAIKPMQLTSERATLEITIKDTGIGIPADKLNQIFDRFHQADSSYSRRYGGLGMGLTLSKAYVELMGGHMDVESQPGQGSTFICTIPFALQNATTDISAWEDYQSTVRVLIVDDTLRGEVLYKHIGSSLSEVTTGANAINILLTAQRRKEPFDVVIIDQQLASIDAMQLGARINNQTSLVLKPMLLLLMPPSPITAKERAKAIGFFDCLTKPVHPSELLALLTASWEKWTDKNHPRKKAAPAIPVSAHWRVLLVEDSPVVQRVHIRMLEKLGCQVDLAENAMQALAMCANDYDVIFMDVGLPEISGLEITEEIRHREGAKKHTPIIAITGFAHEEDKNNCLAAGMDAVATKPIKPEDLKEILLKWGGNYSTDFAKTIQS